MTDEQGRPNSARDADFEDDSIEYVSRFSPVEQPEWLALFDDECPRLFVDLFRGVQTHKENLDRKAFEERLRRTLREFGKDELSAAMTDGLFSLACEQNEHMSQVLGYVEKLKSPNLSAVRQFLHHQTQSLNAVEVILSRQSPAAPAELAAWTSIWYESLRAIMTRMSSEIAFAQEIISSELAGWWTDGTTQFESYLLLEAQERVKTLMEIEGKSSGVIRLLVAYADASKLVPYNLDGGLQEPEQAIKMRLSRARNSEKRYDFMRIRLMLSVAKSAGTLGRVGLL